MGSCDESTRSRRRDDSKRARAHLGAFGHTRAAVRPRLARRGRRRRARDHELLPVAARHRPPVQGTGVCVKDQLLARVLDHDELAELDAAERRLALRRLVAESTEAANVSSTVAQLADIIDGFGPLAAPMRDQHVTDVLVNGPHEVWIERDGRLVPTDISWPDAEELHAFAERVLGDVGVRVDASVPIADARL